jgi:protein phosphatase
MWHKKHQVYNNEGFNIVAATHSGRVLQKNEDRFVIQALNDHSVLCAVADGLGGTSNGDYAAEIVRKELSAIEEIHIHKSPGPLLSIAQEIDRQICHEGEKNPTLKEMGSTLIGVLLQNSIAYWVHAGDSRLYLLREKQLFRLTKDQTLARFLLEEGEIKPEQLDTHYSKNIMDQYLGCGFCEPEEGSFKIKPKDILIISSDGLHKYIDFDMIFSIIKTSASIESKVDSLVHAALEKGGKDNITVVAIEVLHGVL